MCDKAGPIAHGVGLDPLIEEGRLVEVMKGQVPQLPRYSLNYRSKKHMTRRLRAFIDLAKEVSG